MQFPPGNWVAPAGSFSKRRGEETKPSLRDKRVASATHGKERQPFVGERVNQANPTDLVRELDAGNPQIQFDERGAEAR
jgi:hypothetical protein